MADAMNSDAEHETKAELPKSDISNAKESIETEAEEDWTYPSRKVTIPAIAGIYLMVFLVALDRTILGTAIPTITNDFQSFGDVAWYEAGFLLPLCMLQPTFGRIYTYYPAKWVLVILVAIFEIGSIVCATAPNSNVLIGGRAISGAGSAGIFSGGQVLINQLVPLQTRPKVAGGIGSMFGISSILGPILGGYLTSVTWRWCFWINVPIGAVSLLVLVLCTPKQRAPAPAAETWIGKFWQLDPLGFVLVASASLCLLFALQFGGVRYPWNSAVPIALLVVAGVLFLAFIAAQAWRGEKSTIPPRIFRQRSIFWGGLCTIGLGSVLVIFPYYLPVWFQVVQGKSPQSSGLSLLPLLLSLVVATILSGITTSAFGYYTPILIIGSAILIVGSALITTWTADIGTGRWIGYQIVAGLGLGMGLQQPNVAAQTVLSQKDVTIGFTYLTFISFLAGSIFVTVCQTVLQNRLVTLLEPIIPGLDPSTLTNAGASSLSKLVSGDTLTKALEAYNEALKSIWYVALGLSCLSFVTSFGVEWKSVKKEGKKRESSKA